MKKKLAFVLGGGGARGALQVGALRALLEAGYQPDWLVGTSVGAINSVFLAMKGVNLDGVHALTLAWRDAAHRDLLPSNYLWLTVRSLFNRPVGISTNRLRDYCIECGVTHELKFESIKGVGLLLVASDLNSGSPVLYGREQNDSILEAVLASCALPPWSSPFRVNDQLLMDGGVVSNLPVEPAMSIGVDEIIALDLTDDRMISTDQHGFGMFVNKLLSSVQLRQAEMEIALAKSCGVRVRHIRLLAPDVVPLWDFHKWEEMIACGYGIACGEIERWKAEEKPWWQRWLPKSGME